MTECDVSSRFGGIARVYGEQALTVLPSLHVAVVGIGGVGSWAVEALARSGIGQVTLIDHDEVCITNTNRQLHALNSTIGQSKLSVMSERAQDINPDMTVNIIDDYLTDRTLADYLNRGYDYVIDAIDSIKFKSAMIYYCKRNKIPIITTGGAGGLVDPTQITISDLSRTYNDALAAKVRSQLRSDYGFSKNPKSRFGVECVFSTEQPVYPKENGTVSHQKPGIHGVSLDCRFGYGSFSGVTAVSGFTAASRVINKLMHKHGVRQLPKKSPNASNPPSR